MTKNFVKRSQFQTLVLTTGVTSTLEIQGDEAYVVVDNATAMILFATAREQEWSKFLTANGLALTSQPAEIFHTAAAKRAPLNAGFDSSFTSYLVNNDLNQSLCGIKEKMTFRIHPSSPITNNVRIVIETVHYVPVDAIAA